MISPTVEELVAFLDEQLPAERMAEIEQALRNRNDDQLQNRLAGAVRRQSPGHHSVGAIWRRRHLSCPTRAELGSFLLAFVCALLLVFPFGLDLKIPKHRPLRRRLELDRCGSLVCIVRVARWRQERAPKVGQALSLGMRRDVIADDDGATIAVVPRNNSSHWPQHAPPGNFVYVG